MSTQGAFKRAHAMIMSEYILGLVGAAVAIAIAVAIRAEVRRRRHLRRDRNWSRMQDQ